MLLCQLIQRYGLLGIAVVRIKKLFCGSYDINTMLDEGREGWQDFRKRGNCRKESHINVSILEGGKVAGHRDTKALLQPDNLSQVTALLCRVSIHRSHDMPARFLDE